LTCLKVTKWCRVGVTITSLDETFRKILEPYTANYKQRIRVLEILKDYGISTYLSCEPIMTVEESNPLPLVKRLRDVVDLFEFGKYNRQRKYDYTSKVLKFKKNDKFYCTLFNKVKKYCNKNEIEYCISSHSRPFFIKHKLPFKPYPLLNPKPIMQQKTLKDFLEYTN